MMTTYTLDIETDSLEAQRIWCVCVKALYSDDYIVATKAEDLSFITQDDTLITHNGVQFDIPILNRLWNTGIKLHQVKDTLIMSRLFNHSREGGHSLGQWGKRLAFKKMDFDNFKSYSDKMVEYCKRDVALTEKIYFYLKREGENFSDKSIQLEHEIAHIISLQSNNGFYLNRKKANDLFEETFTKANLIKEQLQKEFKPKPKILKEVTPKIKKDGTLSPVGLNKIKNCLETVGGKFSLIEFVDFNLGSPKQIIERLDSCGWKPVEFTPKGSAKICERNLETISDTAPQSAKKLAEWKMLESRWKTVESWLKFCGTDNRIHGKVMTMGAVTGRMTHSDPNMANVVSSEKPYGRECRECFTVEDADNYSMVGMDAKGLELRMLAHYMNDKEYTDIVLHGDPHTANQEATGLRTRSQAKTFIYAFLYGAGAERLGSVVNGTARDGAMLKKKFLYNMPSLQKLLDKVQRLSSNGSIKGLDGRRLIIRHQHASLNTLLQGAGAITCKQWSICMHRYIKDNKLNAKLVNTIHDELQYEVHNDDVEQMIIGADKMMQEAGKLLGVRLQLNADAKVGTTWADTH